MLTSLARAPDNADVITLTVGGNDLLSGYFWRTMGDRSMERVMLDEFRSNMANVFRQVAAFGCPVVANTIYDPTDGDDTKAEELGLSPEVRGTLRSANALISGLARMHGFLLCDLEALFHGHGFWSEEPWYVLHIEPNLEGATQIAKAWYGLLRG